MAISKIPMQGFSEQGINFRNIIINGDMSIAQRGTSSTGISGNGYFSVDRFKHIISGLGTWTASQSTDVPTGQGFANSFKMDCTTADASPAAGDYNVLAQIVEGANIQHLKKGTSSAESITWSFWVKSNKTGTYICEILDGNNTRQISKSYTISSSNTWEKKTITMAGDTSGAIGTDASAFLQFNFWLAVGSDRSSGTLNTSWNSTTNANRAVGQVNLADSTSNEWYITGVQLEAGTTASDFEFLPVDVNLKRCQRYYQTLGYGHMAIHESGSTYVMNVPHIQTMRSVPSKGLNISSNLRVRQFGTSDRDASSPSISSSNGSNNGSYIKVTGFGSVGSTSSVAGVGYTTSSENGDVFKLDAEL